MGSALGRINNMASPRPFSARPLDFIYFLFFMIHIPASLLVDFQAIYPSHLVPRLVQVIPTWYVGMSGDPFISGAMGFLGNKSDYVWFKTFLYLEAAFQFPVFILGLRGLWKDSRLIYVLLLIYGASTSTTTLACLSVLMQTPTTSPSTIAANVVSVSSTQRILLLSSYLPFFFLPLGMTVDMGVRIHNLVVSGLRADKRLKAQ